MHATFIRTPLSALALAATLILSACGGGDAGPAAETTPPTMNIASSVVSGAAAGPVTFTFTFSEDVGTSFTAADVAVTNGTKGAFTAVSATQYTLVVTPPANASGNVGVAVAAGSFADLVGNMGGAASASVAFDSQPPVVTVSSSAAGTTAAGDVTLTFNFTKDVGTSFDAADVSVTGGTKGTFTRVDGTRATLVVKPDANAESNLVIGVAAGAIADAAGRTNTAAVALTQAYNTRVAPALVQVVRANAAGSPAYDSATGKALPGNFVTGNYTANAGEVNWWGGNFADQIQMGYGFSKTNAAQWGFGIYIVHGAGGWDISNTTHYKFTLGSNGECAGVCKVTVRLVNAAVPACVADAKVTLTSADITTAYSVKLSDLVVSGCATNTAAAFIAQKVGELHFQMLRADMQFTTSGDPVLFPNGLGVGGNIFFEKAAAAPPPVAPLQIVRANAAGTPAYDKANGKALPANYVTGNYTANAGEVNWWGGNFDEQIQMGYGFSKTNVAQWGFGIFIANGGAGWDISGHSNYNVTLGTNPECATVCKVTLRMVSASNAACVADAKVTLTSADVTTKYKVPLASFTVSGCATNTAAAFKAMKVAELHFQMLRADMQFTTSGDPSLFPNGLGVGGNIFFD
jgi:Bacterial Ig-like domain